MLRKVCEMREKINKNAKKICDRRVLGKMEEISDMMHKYSSEKAVGELTDAEFNKMNAILNILEMNDAERIGIVGRFARNLNKA